MNNITPLVGIDCGQGGIALSKNRPIFYSALLLTGVNLLLRFVGTSYQVYLSSRIGAEGIGLLQLVLSVGSMAMVAGIAGVRTASMYLTAEELGKGHPENTRWVLSGCLLYSLLCSGAVAVALYTLAPFLAENWIRNTRTLEAIRLFSMFLPVNCLTGVMVGYFTGANRIGTLAAVEVAEQCVSMVTTLGLLNFWAGETVERCCQAVVMGSGLSACLTLSCLTFLRLREGGTAGQRIPVSHRLANVALPLAMADDLKTGINMIENLIVPRQLALCPDVLSPLAAFGVVSGMVFPILMFPACILYGLAELLIPELARCVAADSKRRIRYLARRTVKIGALYGALFCGLIFLLAEELGVSLYGSMEAGKQLRLYALLIPMLYCDAIVDAMVKGLGQQKACVRYNILTSALDVIFLYLLLPQYGMIGYFISFFVTHLLNFVLSLRRLMKIAKIHIPLYLLLWIAVAVAVALWMAFYIRQAALRVLVYPVVLMCLLRFMKIIRPSDVRWIKGLIVLKR